MDDADRLIELAQAGDRQALERLLARHEPDVRRFAQRMCGTSDDAEEAAQEALVVAFRRIGAFRRAARFTTWLFTIVRRECARRWRRVSRHRPLPDALAAADADGSGADREQVVAAVADALAALGPDDRALLVLRDIDGRSGDEVAACLGISLAAQKSRLHRARLAVREHVSRRLAGDEV